MSTGVTSRPAAEHLLVESQGPWAGPGCASFVRDAAALARSGCVTTVFLVQDGILAAVPGLLPELAEVLASGGRLWVDRYSCLQRGMSSAGLRSEARWTDMDEVAAKVLDPAVRVVWH